MKQARNNKRRYEDETTPHNKQCRRVVEMERTGEEKVGKRKRRIEEHTSERGRNTHAPCVCREKKSILAHYLFSPFFQPLFILSPTSFPSQVTSSTPTIPL